MNAHDLTLRLGGKWHRVYGTAACPVCQQDRRRDQDALTLADGDDGRLLLHCKRLNCGFMDILAAAGVTAGDYRRPDPAEAARREAERRREDKKRAEQARALWREAIPIEGTPAETYIRARGITCPLPKSLRYHPECWHGPTSRRYPALVAAVQGADLPAAHRTFIKADGSGKAGLPGGDKLMLGPVSGGAVRLSGRASRLVVCEGIETGLSLVSGLLDAPAAVWAALSTSGMCNLRLPNRKIRANRIVIASDGDVAGRKAAIILAERAHALGWTVSRLDPGDDRDFNDVLIRKAVAA